MIVLFLNARCDISGPFRAFENENKDHERDPQYSYQHGTCFDSTSPPGFHNKEI